MPKRPTSKKKAPKRIFSDEDIIKAVYKGRGLTSKVCEALHITRITFLARKRANPEIRRAMIDAARRNLDNAEDQLFKAVEEGAPWAIQYILSRLGKERGYVERKETETKAHIHKTTGPEIDWDRVPTELKLQLLDHIRQQKEGSNNPPMLPPPKPA